jgi:phage terminase small subunit
MNKKPPELHLIDGTKPRGLSTKTTATIPETLKKRIPKAEWVDNPGAWDKEKFIAETADFLYSVYGIGNDQDRHALAMLADHIDTYVACNKGIKASGILTKIKDKDQVVPSPYIMVRNKTTTLIIHLMNELGLTPRGRLSATKIDEESSVAKFLRGPKG